MNVGDLLDLDIVAAAHGGVFVAHHEGRVVFVADAIPGERVRARLTSAGDASFWRAETVAVLDASPHRRAHVWPAADVAVPPERRPGGADLGHVDLAFGRELKVRIVHDALTRIGGADLPVRLCVPDGTDGTRWRTRIGLHVDDAGRVGPFAARSHTVVPVADLPLATDAVARAAQRLPGRAGLRPGRVDLVEPADGRVRVIPRPARNAPHEDGPGGAGRRARAGRLGRHGRSPLRETVVERVGAREFQVDAGGFWQVHRRAAAVLTGLVSDALAATGGVDPDGLHLDLYGGVGLFGALLGEKAGPGARLVSVEADVRAGVHAAHNLAEWPGVRVETARVDRWLAGLAPSTADRDRIRRGAVVLDPPRAGAGADVVRGLAALRPASIVYVACDPVALARDLKTFRALGYEAPEVVAADLFPFSHHVEAVAALTRAVR